MAARSLHCPVCGTLVVVPGEHATSAVRCSFCGSDLNKDGQSTWPKWIAPCLAAGAIAFVLSIVVGILISTVNIAGHGDARAVPDDSVPRNSAAPVAEQQRPGNPAQPLLVGTQIQTPSAGPAAPASAAPAPAAAIAYHWKPGETYSYAFTLEFSVGGKSERHSVVRTYLAKALPSADSAREQKATGTGFAVSSDGYLVTCAHVIEDAAKIEVALGGKTYDAKVIGIDHDNDLAVIRIAADKLPVLPLGNTAAVELGQEVRAVGFPISNVLGDSVKISRGTIAGIIDDHSGKRFQIDASINPGNSGGPLVDEQGAVVGIANAKLLGEQISNVAFAVPVNRALELLEKHKVGCVRASQTEKLSGPDLARRVIPSVALITVSIARGPLNLLSYVETYPGTAPGPLHISGFNHLNPYRRSPPPPRSFHGSTRQAAPTAGRAAPAAGGKGELLVSARGEIVDERSAQDQLAFLGSVANVGIESLPPPGQPRWEATRDFVLITAPADGSTAVRRLPFQDRTSFELGQSAANSLTIKKHFDVKSTPQGADSTSIRIAGDATVVFNVEKGLAEGMDGTGTLSISDSGLKLELPVKLSYKLMSAKPVPPMAAAPRAAPTPSFVSASPPGIAGDTPGEALPPAELPKPQAPLSRIAVSQTAKTALLGGGETPQAFTDQAPQGALLVGLRAFKGKKWGGALQAIQPVYQLEDRYLEGKLLGKPGGTQVLLLAKPGYAVGGINVRAGIAFDSVQLVFMRVNGAALNPQDTYTSEWAGHDGGQPRQASGAGKPGVGVFAFARDELTGMGLLLAESAAVVPSKAAPEPTSARPAESSDDFRTWTTADGKFSVEAKLTGREGESASLLKRGGKSITVPIAKLSAADQQYLRLRAPGAVNDSPSMPRRHADRVSSLLEDLGPSNDFSKRYVALSSLATMRPTDARRKEVAAAVAPMMADKNSSIRTTAIRTIGVWGVKENIPALLDLLEEKDLSLRWAAMAALGKIGDATAAKRLAESMLDSTDRLTAAQALTELGPPAEESVIGLLGDRDDQVRYNACNVLGQIGSTQGVAALQQFAAKESNGFVKAAATIALKKLSDKLEPNKE